MAKITQEFEITYPLKQKIVRDCILVTEHVGDLIVTGTAYCDPSVPMMDVFNRYDVDIDFVRWNGTDIRSVLEVIGGMEEIYEAAHKAAAHLFTEKEAA